MTRKFTFRIQYLILIPIVLLSACTMQAQNLVSETELYENFDFQFTDARPEIEKTSKLGTAFTIKPCDYGIHRFGDEKFKPTTVILLKNKLQSEFGQKLRGKNITLNRFAAYRNMQWLTREAVIGMGGTGLIPFLMSTGACLPDSSFPGGYDEEENPAHNNVDMALIELSIDNQKYNVRHLHEFIDEDPASDKTHMGEAVTQAIDNLLQQIEPVAN